jgi:aerobic-type carbon monoxide dehydrogenase small subunit (CoxS/CutS family)
MDSNFTLDVNGQSHTVSTDAERTLLDVLRENLQLTGTKYGCGEGQCRACTVLLDGRSVASCLTSVSDAAGKKILTIEGVGNALRLHPVQQAFVAESAFQCGYCTAGMVLGTIALLKANNNPSDSEIVSGMQKHLCRCCSYSEIISAVRRAAKLSANY